MSKLILHTEGVTQRFGGLTAVSQVSIDLYENEIVGIIGPNGAGKTTFFNVLTGIYTPTEGKVFLNEQDITGKMPNEIARLGMTRNFQNIRLFSNMTIMENIMTGIYCRKKANLLDAVLSTPRHRREERETGIAETFSEALGALAGAAVPVFVRERYAEALQGSARGTVSVIASFTEEDSLTAAAFAGALTAAVRGCKNTPAALNSGDALAAAVHGSKNLPTRLELPDSLTSETAGSKNIPGALLASEVLTSMLEATSQTTERTTLQLTIPPGGELRIDSELFSVLLNGENALHTQSGDWINISRSLLRLVVESASGGRLEGQLIYTERYL
jgi:hypothetical protein